MQGSTILRVHSAKADVVRDNSNASSSSFRPEASASNRFLKRKFHVQEIQVAELFPRNKERRKVRKNHTLRVSLVTRSGGMYSSGYLLKYHPTRCRGRGLTRHEIRCN